MAALIYSAIASLDGYIEDKDANFDQAEPDEEVHASVNDLERPIGTYLYGRRMYETMVYWEAPPDAAEKPSRRSCRSSRRSGRRPTRSSTPRRCGRHRAQGPGSSGSSTLSRSGGGGKRSLPDGLRVNLELQDERRFVNGTVYLRYAAAVAA
jgi:hypothetical protein